MCPLDLLLTIEALPEQAASDAQLGACAAAGLGEAAAAATVVSASASIRLGGREPVWFAIGRFL